MKVIQENNIASVIDMNTNKDLIKCFVSQSIPMTTYWFIKKDK